MKNLQIALVFFLSLLAVEALAFEPILNLKYNDSVEIIVSRGRIHLQLRAENIYGRQTYVLKELVKKMTSKVGKITRIGDWRVVYEGGFPLWGPYLTDTKNGRYVCFEFSEKIQLSGNEIHFWGEEKPPNAFYLFNQ